MYVHVHNNFEIDKANLARVCATEMLERFTKENEQKLQALNKSRIS